MNGNDENANLIDDHEEATIGMSEVDGFDFERAVMLMTVMEKCANIGVKSTSIGGLAAAALNEMNEEAKAIATRRAEEFKKAEAKAAAEAAFKQREEQDRKQREADDAAEAKAAARPKAIPATAPVFKPAPAPAPTPTDTPSRRV
jgi:hypothetical protein